MARIADVAVRYRLIVQAAVDHLAHGQFRHGGERSWGGYGGGGYERNRDRRE